MLKDAIVAPGATFNIETCCDHLIIEGVGVEFSNAVPTTLRTGDILTWRSDKSVTNEGWQLCFSDISI